MALYKFRIMALHIAAECC